MRGPGAVPPGFCLWGRNYGIDSDVRDRVLWFGNYRIASADDEVGYCGSGSGERDGNEVPA